MSHYYDTCFTCQDYTKHDLKKSKCTECNPKHNTNKFNFVIFKNYDGTTTGKSIPREAWNRLNS